MRVTHAHSASLQQLPADRQEQAAMANYWGCKFRMCQKNALHHRMQLALMAQRERLAAAGLALRAPGPQGGAGTRATASARRPPEGETALTAALVETPHDAASPLRTFESPVEAKHPPQESRDTQEEDQGDGQERQQSGQEEGGGQSGGRQCRDQSGQGRDGQGRDPQQRAVAFPLKPSQKTLSTGSPTVARKPLFLAPTEQHSEEASNQRVASSRQALKVEISARPAAPTGHDTSAVAAALVKALLDQARGGPPASEALLAYLSTPSDARSFGNLGLVKQALHDAPRVMPSAVAPRMGGGLSLALLPLQLLMADRPRTALQQRQALARATLLSAGHRQPSGRSS